MARPNAPIAIVGPTGVGKSSAAEAAARHLAGEIVSADSMQVYRGMDIGTAKTPVHERHVPYHCIDIVDPGQAYSAALFQADARRAIDDVLARRRVSIVCGGTGLYLRAALDEMVFPAGERDTTIRRHYERLAEELGADGLHALLRERDRRSAEIIDPRNVRRVVRALEMADSGVSYALQAAGLHRRVSHYPGTRWFGLTMDRGVLYERIDQRVDAMVDAGLLDEVRQLVQAGHREALTSSQAIGYKELVGVVDGTADLDVAVETVKRGTRRYAKRQLTWFRADPRVVWLDVTGLTTEAAAAAILDLVESTG